MSVLLKESNCLYLSKIISFRRSVVIYPKVVCVLRLWWLIYNCSHLFCEPFYLFIYVVKKVNIFHKFIIFKPPSFIYIYVHVLHAFVIYVCAVCSSSASHFYILIKHHIYVRLVIRSAETLYVVFYMINAVINLITCYYRK